METHFAQISRAIFCLCRVRSKMAKVMLLLVSTNVWLIKKYLEVKRHYPALSGTRRHFGFGCVTTTQFGPHLVSIRFFLTQLTKFTELEFTQNPVSGIQHPRPNSE
jgi:hypothetical protein